MITAVLSTQMAFPNPRSEPHTPARVNKCKTVYKQSHTLRALNHWIQTRSRKCMSPLSTNNALFVTDFRTVP